MRWSVLILSLAASLPGQTLVPPVRPFHAPPRIGVLAEAHITLDQVLAMALKSNKDIESSRIDKDEAEYNVMSALGVFDPLIGGTGLWSKQEAAAASSLSGSTTGAVLTKIWQGDPTLSGFTPWLGGSYKVDFLSQRLSTNNSFATLNPQFPDSLNFQYTQPLWRGLRYDVNRHGVDVAKKNRALSQEQFKQRVMTITQQAEQAYWELVYAYNNLGVQFEAVDIGRQQDESNRRQEEQGLLAPIDVVAAQTQLANFELSAYSAQQALTRAENNLKTLILPDRASPLWASALIPETPPISNPPVIPVQDAVQEALTDRPETAQVKINGEINERDTQYYRELTKPQVDLIGSYSLAGLAGPIAITGANPLTGSFGPIIDRINSLSAANGLLPITLTSSTIPTFLVGGYGQSISNLFADNFPTTQVQLRVSFPIRNRVAGAALNRVIAEHHRIQNQKEQVEQTVESDVRNAMQAMVTAQSRLEAARVARESAEEQYQSEQRQFRAGTSTLFLVQQRQSTMIAARSQERRAEADAGQAQASYELATGSILRRHNITLQ